MPMLRALLLAAALLSGCTVTPDCYVGVSLFPPSPIFICGLGVTPPEKPDVRLD